MKVEAVAQHHTQQVVELFEETDCPCFCQYHSFSGDARQWQVRCANDRQTNRSLLEAQLAAGDIQALVAIDEDRVVGWGRIAEPGQLEKIYQGRLYRGLPCFETGPPRTSVWAVACFLVVEEYRRRGVATALLQGMKQLARERGASHLEAFPRGASDVSDGEQWLGPLELLRAEGFEIVHDFAPYPVVRCRLL